LGKVRGNSMIDLQIMSTKLRDRAVRLVSEISGSDYETAQKKLEANNWNLRAAVDSPNSN
jgi:N-acetylmuramic acid 6-phosphate (MurNAc-6-P) etherase